MKRKPMATRRKLHTWSIPEVVIAVLCGFTVILMTAMTTAVLMGY